jgi:hypothetical protein
LLCFERSQLRNLDFKAWKILAAEYPVAMDIDFLWNHGLLLLSFVARIVFILQNPVEIGTITFFQIYFASNLLNPTRDGTSI